MTRSFNLLDIARLWNTFLLAVISLFLVLAVLSTGIVQSGAVFDATELIGAGDNLTSFYPSLDPDLTGFQYPACDILVTKVRYFEKSLHSGTLKIRHRNID